MTGALGGSGCVARSERAASAGTFAASGSISAGSGIGSLCSFGLVPWSVLGDAGVRGG